MVELFTVVVKAMVELSTVVGTVVVAAVVEASHRVVNMDLAWGSTIKGAKGPPSHVPL